MEGYEYQMRVEGGTWSNWDSSWMPNVDADGDVFNFQFGGLINDTTYEIGLRANTTGPKGRISTAFATPGIVELINGRVDLTAARSEVATCTGIFSDGVGDYLDSRFMGLVLAPDLPVFNVRVTFTSFSTEESTGTGRTDTLRIYDGPNSQADQIGEYSGTVLPPVITATNSSGKLYFLFQTNQTVVDEGWEAEISCIAPKPGPGTAPHLLLSPSSSSISVRWLATESSGGVSVTAYQYQLQARQPMGTWPAAWESDMAPTSVDNGEYLELTFDSLTDGTPYEVRVRAQTSQGTAGDIGYAFGTPGVAELSDGRVDMLYDGEVTTCSGIFSDGPGRYGIQRFLNLVLAPDHEGGKVRLTFTSFNIEERFDILGIYAGDTALPDALIGEYTGEELPPVAASSSADGKLALRFFSDVLNSGEGWEATIDCISVPEPPLVPMALSSVGALQVELSWTVPEDGGSPISGYKIESSPDGTGSWSDVEADTGSTTPNYSHTGLVSGNTIYYRVSAISGVGTGPASGTVSATVADAPVLVAPGIPSSLVALSSFQTTDIELSWIIPGNGGSPITGYKIESSPDGNASWSDVVADTGSSIPSYSHTGLGRDDVIYYRVSAINALGTSMASNVAKATAGVRDPSVVDVTDPVLEGNPVDQVFTRGTMINPLILPTAMDESEVFYTLTPELPEGLEFVAETRTLQGTPTETIVWTSYTYTATDDSGNSSSLTFRISIIGLPLSHHSKAQDQNSTVRVFPNPAVDTVYLDLTEARDYSMTLLSMTGKVVMNEEFAGGGVREVTISHLPNGTYILMLEGQSQDGDLQVFRVVVDG